MVFRSLFCSPVQFVKLFVGGLETICLLHVGLQLHFVKSVVVTFQPNVAAFPVSRQ